jgi:hypothetical protein
MQTKFTNTISAAQKSVFSTENSKKNTHGAFKHLLAGAGNFMEPKTRPNFSTLAAHGRTNTTLINQKQHEDMESEIMSL